MSVLIFKLYYADPNVWMHPQTKPNGTKYFEKCLIFVDDILCFSHARKGIMDCLSKVYRLKEGSVKEPDRYLGANIKKIKK